MWDGLDDAGDKVEPGRYRLRVTLPEEDRVMVFPKRLDVRVGDVGEDATATSSRSASRASHGGAE